jgi:hypothetical protein
LPPFRFNLQVTKFLCAADIPGGKEATLVVAETKGVIPRMAGKPAARVNIPSLSVRIQGSTVTLSRAEQPLYVIMSHEQALTLVGWESPLKKWSARDNGPKDIRLTVPVPAAFGAGHSGEIDLTGLEDVRLMSYVYVEGLSAADIQDMVGQLPDLPRGVSFKNVAMQNGQESGNIRITWSDYVVSLSQFCVQHTQMNSSRTWSLEERGTLESRTMSDCHCVGSPTEQATFQACYDHFEDQCHEVVMKVCLLLRTTTSDLTTLIAKERAGSRTTPDVLSNRQADLIILGVFYSTINAAERDMKFSFTQTHVEGSDIIRQAGINIRPAQHRFEEQVFWKKSTITVFGTNGVDLSSEQVP